MLYSKQAKQKSLSVFNRLKEKAKKLKQELNALYLCYKDPRTPRSAKLLLVLVLGYALSPIDLIPDFIPILGYLDDLILVPLGIRFCIKLIPPHVLAENRKKAETLQGQKLKKNYVFAVIFVFIWVAVLVWLVFVLRNLFTR